MATALLRSFSLNTVKQNIFGAADVMPSPERVAIQREKYLAYKLSQPPESKSLRSLACFDVSTGHGVAVGPLLVIKETQGGEDEERDFNYHIPSPEANLAVTKCRCGSSWCPSCFTSRSSKVIKDHLSQMDHKKVRFIMLSVDRSRYATGEDAFKALTERKAIAGLIRNLNRYADGSISKWQWVLEWHEDGFPHWHVACEVANIGKRGLIGHETIMKYWGEGHVRESYVKNVQHWREISGYFATHGYFDDSKGYQSVLPEWALSWSRTIRRYGASVGTWADSGKNKSPRKDKKRDKKINDADRPKRPRASYKIIIAACGIDTKIRVITDNGKFTTYQWVARCPYKQALKDLTARGFGYQPGIGLMKVVNNQNFREIMQYFKTFGFKGGFNREGIESYN